MKRIGEIAKEILDTAMRCLSGLAGVNSKLDDLQKKANAILEALEVPDTGDQELIDDIARKFHSKLDRLQAVIENFNQPKEK